MTSLLQAILSLRQDRLKLRICTLPELYQSDPHGVRLDRIAAGIVQLRKPLERATELRGISLVSEYPWRRDVSVVRCYRSVAFPGCVVGAGEIGEPAGRTGVRLRGPTQLPLRLLNSTLEDRNHAARPATVGAEIA